MTSLAAGPVRLDYDDFVAYTELHPDESYELLDGVIYRLAPEGDAHALTRSGIYTYLSDVLDRKQYAVWSEMSFPAPGYADGPKPDNFVSRGAWMVDGKFGRRPTADDVVLFVQRFTRSLR